MSWTESDPRVTQALRKFKVFLDRITPNKAAEAEMMHVFPSTVSRWCNPTKDRPDFPAALIPLHSEAVKILDILAHQVGHTVIPSAPPADLDGDVRDEVLACNEELGKIAGQVRAALRDLVSPGQIDQHEANTLLDQARDLQKATHALVTELSLITARGPA